MTTASRTSMIAAAVAAAGLSFTASASFIGAEVSGQMFFQETAASTPIVSTFDNSTLIGDGVEYSSDFAFRGGRDELSSDELRVPKAAIDFTADSVTFDFNETSGFVSAIANGYLFQLFGLGTKVIESATFDMGATYLAVAPSDIEFTADSFAIDFQSDRFSARSQVKVDFTFADRPDENPNVDVPAPASAALLIAGLAAMSGARRLRNKAAK